MRLASYLTITALVLFAACKSPEYKSFQQSLSPVEVTVNIRVPDTSARGMEKEFAAALRARLATFVTVVPEGIEPPPNSARLNVEIDRISRGRVSAGAVGAVTGVAVGLLSAASGNTDTIATLDGLFWGLVVGSEVSVGQRHQTRTLGYTPPRINGYITLTQSGAQRPISIYSDRIPSRAIIEEMRPLIGSDRYNLESINEALAQAFANAVIANLHHKFNWYSSRTPAWYEPPEDYRKNSFGYIPQEIKGYDLPDKEAQETEKEDNEME